MRQGGIALCLFAACRIGFEPIERTGSGDPIDAVGMSDSILVVDSAPTVDANTTVCRMRIPNTDNSYLPIAQCTTEVNAARTTCNADPACVLTGYYWGPGSGINDTGACADGGGTTGLRQWICSTRGSLFMDQVPI